MDERKIRINIDMAAIRRAIPEREPSRLAERLRAGSLVAAPVFQSGIELVAKLLRRR